MNTATIDAETIGWYPKTWSELRDSGVIREMYLDYKKSEYQRNIETYRAYRNAHREQKAARQKIHRRAYKEEIAAKNKTYRLANKDKINAQRRERYARKKELQK